jgi:phospholipase/carboxylesterase
VHGAQDWMFAVGRAVKACKEISSAGADVRLKVVPDLSHAYPRQENDAILIQLQKLW